MHNLIFQKVIKKNAILLAKNLFKTFILIIIGTIVSIAAFSFLGWYLGIVVLLFTLLTIWIYGLSDVFKYIGRIIYWPSNPIYASWKRYGKNEDILNEIEDIILSQDKGQYFLYNDNWVIINSKGFIRFKDIERIQPAFCDLGSLIDYFLIISGKDIKLTSSTGLRYKIRGMEENNYGVDSRELIMADKTNLKKLVNLIKKKNPSVIIESPPVILEKPILD